MLEIIPPQPLCNHDWDIELPTYPPVDTDGNVFEYAGRVPAPAQPCPSAKFVIDAWITTDSVEGSKLHPLPMATTRLQPMRAEGHPGASEMTQSTLPFFRRNDASCGARVKNALFLKSLTPSTWVKIIKNGKPGHHDVTNKL